MARTRKVSRKSLTIRPHHKRGRKATKHRARRRPSMAGLPEGVSLMASRKRRARRSRRGQFTAGAAPRRRRVRRTRRASFHGFAGTRRRRSRRSYMGGGGFSLKGIMPLLLNAGATLGGAIGGSMLAARIPAPDKIKPFIPLAAGVALNVTKLGRNQMVRAAGLGLMIAGGLSLIRQFAPQLPMLGAANETEELLGLPAVSGEDEELLGLIDEDMSGLPAVSGYGYDEELMGAHATGADI